jgi:hypothetical protein
LLLEGGISVVYLDWIVLKLPAAGYYGSDISSMGSTCLPLALSYLNPLPYSQIYHHDRCENLSELVAPTVKAGFVRAVSNAFAS